MLDKYKIQERPGDPSNPLTFWPYQAIYAVPQGIGFAACKEVGSAGANAGATNPLEVSAICQALMALAEVTARNGFSRLFVVGDCGYYALAATAYAQQLLCWGKQSWEPHSGGAFAAFRVPHFYSPSLELEIILCMGTTQFISTPDPQTSIVSQLGGGSSLIYVTADTRGWYGCESLKKVEDKYAKLLTRPWAGPDWHFHSNIEMMDVVVRVNEGLLQAALLVNLRGTTRDLELKRLVDRMLEFNYGSTAFLLGIFLGNIIAQEKRESGDTLAERIWKGSSKLRPLALQMACAANGKTPLSEPFVFEACTPFFEYLKLLMHDVHRVSLQLEESEPLTEMQEWRCMVVLIGNPANKDGAMPSSLHEMKRAIAMRVQDSLLSLLALGDNFQLTQDLPLGESFVEVLAEFHVELNDKVLSAVERTHAIDGRRVCLLDSRHVPGFGIQVNLGLTVWTTSIHFTWMSAVMLRFTELLQQRKLCGPIIVHMECTELYNFTPFIQENGVPCIDGINMVSLASRSTSAPMRFVTFTQDKTTNLPPTPAALVADTTEDRDRSDSKPIASARFYRDNAFPMRSPTDCARDYGGLCDPLLHSMRKRWNATLIAQPIDGQDLLVFGQKAHNIAEPGESLYVASAALDLGHGYFLPVGKGGDLPEVRETIINALQKGVPLFKNGDIEGCFKVYKKAAEDICMSDVSHSVRCLLQDAIGKARGPPRSRVWIMRSALESAYAADKAKGNKQAVVQYAPLDDDADELKAFYSGEKIKQSDEIGRLSGRPSVRMSESRCLSLSDFEED